MKRILFFILWICALLVSRSYADIQIIVDGHQYKSLEAYRNSKNPVKVQTQAKPVSLDTKEQDYIRQKARELGINVDFSKVKTFQVIGKSFDDKGLHKFYVLSVENGMIDALNSFYKTWGRVDMVGPREIYSSQLQEVIQKAVVTSKEPKLLISEPGKVRIMALKPQDSSD